MELSAQEIGLVVEKVQALRQQFVANVIGQEYLFSRIIAALLSRSHLLVEGLPGLAKTRAINTIAKSLDLSFKRIQFTPDLLPSDIVGNLIYNPKEGNFMIKLGPVFSNVLLADEINRAPAKVQSALLEAMGEGQVTIGEQTYVIEKPFLVMATQNPIEQEGTFPLPEAQMDRFALKATVSYPKLEDEIAMLGLVENKSEVQTSPVTDVAGLLQMQQTTDKVLVSDQIKRYVACIVDATRHPATYGLEAIAKQISYGASPRAGIAMIKLAKVIAISNGRSHVIPEDIKELAHDTLRHRIVVSFEAQADGVGPEQLIDQILGKVIVP